MFQFMTTVGYKFFWSRAQHYFSKFKNFAGAAHIIPDNDDNDDTVLPPPAPLKRKTLHQQGDSSAKPMESSVQTREASTTSETPHKIGQYGNLRENVFHAIPHT